MSFRPRHRLDRRIDTGRVRSRHVRAIARALAHDHAEAPVARGDDAAPARMLRTALDKVARLSERALFGDAALAALEAGLQDALVRDVERLIERHAQGRVRRIAAPLEPADVRVRGRRVAVADLEREEADVARALAGLVVALRAAGDRRHAEVLLAEYALAADDYDLYGVIALHETLVACERAAEEPDPDAARALLRPWVEGPEMRSRRALVLVSGGVATGKSTLSRAVSRELGLPRVIADRVRQAVLDPITDRLGDDAALERAWSDEFDERVFATMLRRAEAVLASGRSCILDACFPKRADRAQAAELARAHHAALVICVCSSPKERVRRRLAKRDERDGVAPGDWKRIARELEAVREPLVDEEPGRHLHVVTGGPDADVDASVEQIERALRPRPRRGRSAGGFPRAVTFDCWNTLLCERDWPRAHALRVDALQAAVRDAGARFGRSEISAAFDAGWQRHMDLWREGIASGAREVAQWSLEKLGLPLDEDVLGPLTERFQIASHTGRVEALEGSRATLATLHDAGIPMALVCDTGLTPGRVVRLHLERLGLLDALDVQAFSDEVGVPKPDPRIFRAALEPLDVDPAEAVHVGDLVHTDVSGARGLGMGSVRLSALYDDDPAPEADADRVVASHGDLLEVLRGWRDGD